MSETLKKRRPKATLINLDESVLKRVDERANAIGVSRTKFVEYALVSFLDTTALEKIEVKK